MQKKRLKWGIKVPSTGPPNPSCEKGRRQEPEGGHRGRSEASPNLGLSVTRLGQRRSSDGRGPEPAGPGVDVGRETGQETPLPCQPQGQGGQRGSWASRRLRARLASQPPAVDPYDMPGTSYSTPGMSGYSSGGASGSGGPSTSGTTSGPGPSRPARARPRRPREETVSKGHQSLLWGLGGRKRERQELSHSWGEGPPAASMLQKPCPPPHSEDLVLF